MFVCDDIQGIFYIVLGGTTSRLLGFARGPPSLPPSLPACLPPSLPPCLPASLSLSPSLLPSSPPLLLAILGLPGFTQNICVIAQDNCIPEILFKT